MTHATTYKVDPMEYLSSHGFQVLAAYNPEGTGAGLSTGDWAQVTSREEQLWCDEYRLSSAEFTEKYAPFERESMVIGVKEAGEADDNVSGVLRVGFPSPKARTFRDTGLLTVHAAIHGTPGWGTLDISPERMAELDKRYDPGVTIDVQTNVVEPKKRGQQHGGIVFALQSMLADVADALHDARYGSSEEGPPAVILTAFVDPYLRAMKLWYNADEEQGLVAIGGRSPYGAQGNEPWCTPAILNAQASRRVDQRKQHPRPKLVLGLFDIACPGFKESRLLDRYRTSHAS